ncbi:MAG TPA: zinc ribbon domain-containing protein [Symbiobacteriaceae bacterium]|jgi:hypothetical protein|nr:zinc ribbon domain-containing protein [Symbiobacteriaceae bacterium]
MKYKRITAVLALVFSLLCVSALGVRAYSEVVLSTANSADPGPTEAIANRIRTGGFTQEVVAQVRSATLPPDWIYIYVAEGRTPPSSRSILAASLAKMEGVSEQNLFAALMADPRPAYGYASLVTAPDGREYSVGVVRKQNWLYMNTTTYSTLAAMVTGLLAWLALAAWVYLDARQRGSAAAPGWALLGLLAGPLALAVWLVARRTEAAPDAGPEGAPEACPGCGADTVAGASFCVRCGYALRPACPSCRRPVETDWAHCAACGEPLE